MIRLKQILFLILLVGLLLIPISADAEEQPVVRALLFYSPTCPHCHEVIDNGLPPIVDQYGDQLQIVLINVATPGGQQLYLSAAEWAPIPEEMGGVPLMVVGHELLYGSIDIPQRLPQVVETGLAAGGIPWPDMPGMAEVAAEIEAQAEAQAAEAAAGAGEQPAQGPAPQPESKPEPAADKPAVDEKPAAEEKPVVADASAPEPKPAVEEQKELGADGSEAVVLSSDSEQVAFSGKTGFAKLWEADPASAVIAAVVMLVMLVVVIWAAVIWIRDGLPEQAARGWQVWVIPALSIIGLGVAIYLTFVETTEAAAVCGPVGDCNAVQDSQYASLFGVLPVGILGILGYLVILALWLWQRLGPTEAAEDSEWMLPAAAFFGTLFSIYLTYLELFVISAVCMWCITSAVIMTLLLIILFRWHMRPDDAPMPHPLTD